MRRKGLFERLLGMFSSRRYKLARPGAVTKGWLAPHSSADGAAIGDRAVISARAQDLVRNNAFAQSAVWKACGHIVGAGVQPRIQLRSGAIRGKVRASRLLERAREDWWRWQKSVTFDGMSWGSAQRLILSTWMQDGEALAKWSVDANNIPKCSLLDPSRIDTGKQDQGNNWFIVQGVEVDAIDGRVLAYWIFPHHPNDYNVGLRSQVNSAVRRDAATVDLVYLPQRAEQLRGVSIFSSVGERLRRIDTLLGYVQTRLMAEAAITSIVERPDDGSGVGLHMGQEQDGANVLENIYPGQTVYAPPGTKISAMQITSSTSIIDVITFETEAIAAALGLPAHMLTGNVHRANYSSLRAALLDFRAVRNAILDHMLIPRFCDPSFERFKRWFVTQEIARGQVTAAEAEAIWCDWTKPELPHADPLKEAQEVIVKVRAGLMTMQEALSARGLDPADQVLEMSEWSALIDSAGLKLDTDPRNVTASGNLQPNATGASDASIDGGTAEGNDGAI